MKELIGSFAEVCRRRGLKVNVDMSTVTVLGWEEGLECKIHVEGTRLEKVSQFKYLDSVLDESGTDVVECHRKVASGRKVAGATRSIVILGICRFSVRGWYMRDCSWLFCCMALRQ